MLKLRVRLFKGPDFRAIDFFFSREAGNETSPEPSERGFLSTLCRSLSSLALPWIDAVSAREIRPAFRILCFMWLTYIRVRLNSLVRPFLHASHGLKQVRRGVFMSKGQRSQ